MKVTANTVVKLLMEQYDFKQITYSMQDCHALYFYSGSVELKVVTDREPNEFSVECREIGAEDWESIGHLLI